MKSSVWRDFKVSSTPGFNYEESTTPRLLLVKVTQLLVTEQKTQLPDSKSNCSLPLNYSQSTQHTPCSF
jgi:hypothetical protein